MLLCCPMVSALGSHTKKGANWREASEVRLCQGRRGDRVELVLLGTQLLVRIPVTPRYLQTTLGKNLI